MAGSILNSDLFKKVSNEKEFFKIEDLIKEIHENIKSDRELIQSLLIKALTDAESLATDIKTFNSINSLPNIMIFGEIPNAYLDNLNNNVQLQVNLLNSIQKLQSNYIMSNKNIKEKEQTSTIEDLINGLQNDSE